MSKPVWRKSSRSGTGGAGGQECVELATLGNAIGVRDSKNPNGGNLTMSIEAFGELVTRIKADDSNA
ncbi:DUF397 domain-containing protein [Actinomadura sp. LOL_016]|uniref:DUF397 domain-containing protein n=1 Tax=unclassified Actinomadura TaxID=2626254 RepID=UPI003A801C29